MKLLLAKGGVMKKLFLPILPVLVLTLFMLTIPDANGITSGDFVVTNPIELKLLDVTPEGKVTTIVSGYGLTGLAVDSSGNYIGSDFSLGKLLKITPEGKVIIIPPNLGEPGNLAVDSDGNYIVIDETGEASRLLKVTPEGKVTTITSTLKFLTGVAIDSSGNYIVTCPGIFGTPSLAKVTPGGKTTTIVSSGIGVPIGIAIDSSGNYIVTDASAGRLNLITPSGTVTKIASGLGYPYDLTIDSNGNYIVVDNTGSRLLKVTPGGTVTTIASSGLGGGPAGVAIIPSKNSQQAGFLRPNKDSFLRDKSPNTNEGGNSELHIRNLDDQIKRTVISFDQGSIQKASADKTLQSAKLRLHIVKNNNQWGSGRDINIHKLLQDWKEGNGYNAKPDDLSATDFASIKFFGTGQGATWNCAIDNNINNGIQDCDNSWNGGNFDPQKTDSITITNGLSGWIEFDVTPDVQGFLGGGNNFGWIIKKADETQPGLVNFESNEALTNNPQLVLTFANDAVHTQLETMQIQSYSLPKSDPVDTRRDDSSRIPPPSMSGNDLFKISDGFTIGGDSYSVTGNLIDVPTHKLVKNVPNVIVAKSYTDSQLGLEAIHISLNIGPHPMSNIGQSILSISWDKSTGLQVTDPQGLVSNVSVNKQTQGNVDVFTFTFTPIKELSTSDAIIRIWNNKLSSIDYTMTNALKFTGEFLSPSIAQLPSTVKIYDNLSDLQKQLDSDGYAKPQVLSHIHDASSVFNGEPGKLFWFYDTQTRTVSLVIEDANNKVLNIQTGTLIPKAQQSENENFVLGTMSYSHHSLSRNNINEMENAKSVEQLKALQMLIQQYGSDYVMQYHLAGK